MRVLVVDDEVELADVVARGLRQIGMAVDVAYDGEDALYKADISSYDVIVLDIEMPELDGWAVLERLRDVTSAPVVMLTAHAGEEDAVRGLTLGADPLVCAVSAAAYADGTHWTGFFVRKEAKKHGLQHWIEGPFVEEGTPVAIVDDVLTSGGSMLTALEKARAAGAEVVVNINASPYYAGRVHEREEMLRHRAAADEAGRRIDEVEQRRAGPTGSR